MVTKEQIDRINVLAKKKKTEGLTEAEQAEQKVLYRAYIGRLQGEPQSTAGEHRDHR